MRLWCTACLVATLAAGCQDDTPQTPAGVDASLDTGAGADGGGGDLADEPDLSRVPDTDTGDEPDAGASDAAVLGMPRRSAATAAPSPN